MIMSSAPTLHQIYEIKGGVLNTKYSGEGTFTNLYPGSDPIIKHASRRYLGVISHKSAT